MAGPYKVGLTGGIGSGKTVVAAMFAGHGIPVIDADAIVRDLTAPGKPVLQEISKAFGNDILDSSGRLNRDKLRNLVFADETSRHKLESILHPLVYETMEGMIRQITSGYCILSIPLLLETGAESRVDTILVVDAPLDLQIERVSKRDGLSRDQVQAVIAAQMSRKDRLKGADDVILNNGNLPKLAARVNQLHVKYSKLSGKTNDT